MAFLKRLTLRGSRPLPETQSDDQTRNPHAIPGPFQPGLEVLVWEGKEVAELPGSLPSGPRTSFQQRRVVESFEGSSALNQNGLTRPNPQRLTHQAPEVAHAGIPQLNRRALFLEQESVSLARSQFANSRPARGRTLSRSNSTPTLYIGIDFGTTYSGVAWAYSGRPEDVMTITTWDSHNSRNSDKGKAPSRITYKSLSSFRSPDSFTCQSPYQFTENGTQAVSDEVVSWGYDAEEAETIEWFKLLLLKRSDLQDEPYASSQLERARTFLKIARKTPMQATSDYLSKMWTHTLANLRREYGREGLAGIRFDVTVSVPAIWTTAAVAMMKQAVQNAGISQRRVIGKTSISFVSEPEAAAIAAFEDLRTQPNFKKGDVFVVCDAGGGTVDIISYKVRRPYPLEVEECIEGAGALCGAVFLDQEFKRLVKERLQETWESSEAEIADFMWREWENSIKCHFDGKDDKIWIINVPAGCVRNGAPHQLKLSGSDIGRVFNSIVPRILTLVMAQVNTIKIKENQEPKAIVLVGGLGSSPYLYNVLETSCRDRGIEVYQPRGYRPLTAICRGAVLRAMTNASLTGNTIRSRIARRGYGFVWCPDFKDGVHLEEDRFWDGLTGKYLAGNQMKWFLKRGRNVDATRPLSKGYQCPIRISTLEPDFLFACKIYSSASNNPPSRKNSTLEYLGRLEKSIDLRNLKSELGKDGNDYKVIRYTIHMSVIGAVVEFSIFFEDGASMKHVLDIEL